MINVPLHVSLVFVAPCLAISFVILPVSLLTTFIAVAHLVAMSQRARVTVRGSKSYTYEYEVEIKA